MIRPMDSEQLRKIFTEGRFRVELGEDPDLQFEVKGIEESPCAGACPAGVNVKGYVGLIASSRFQEALDLVRRDNPLPGICGRVCHHPCEVYCRRSEVDEPVAICWLKRFVADWELKQPSRRREPLPRTRWQKVAVVGSGPAGLTAASDLRRMGYGVTVFESHSEPGGMLRVGIPEFRLPRDILETEIGAILDLGIELRTHTRVGDDVALADLLGEEGFGAVFIAVGAHAARKMGIPGEEGIQGSVDCVSFLKGVNMGSLSIPGQRILIIGGGHSAVDCGRTALRLGAQEVRIVYRRTLQEMPAGADEVEQTEAEGVIVDYLTSPLRILEEGGQVKGLRCIKNSLGEPDASGRRRPVPIPGSEFLIEADAIISAISQKPDLSFNQAECELAVSGWGTLEADEATLATSCAGIFAGGDVATGPGTVVDAIGQGHRAAYSIHCYLRGEDPIQNDRLYKQRPLRAEAEVPHGAVGQKPRHLMPRLHLKARRDSFQEVDLGFSEEAAVQEASRCLRCGPCSECTVCVPSCSRSHLIMTLPAERFEVQHMVVRVPRGEEALRASSGPLAAAISWKKTARNRGRSAHAEAQLRPATCSVQEQYCRACGTCVSVCEYGAASLHGGEGSPATARIDAELCKGCGVCVSQCPSSAIVPSVFTDEWVESALGEGPLESMTLVFSCRWNAVAVRGMLSGMHRIRHVPVMCSGRVQPGLILKVFERGAGKVVLARCPQDSCHYGFGSRVAEANTAKAKALAGLLGISSRRLQTWSLGSQDFATSTRAWERSQCEESEKAHA